MYVQEEWHLGSVSHSFSGLIHHMGHHKSRLTVTIDGFDSQDAIPLILHRNRVICNMSSIRKDTDQQDP
jgi:hypothetical protein